MSEAQTYGVQTNVSLLALIYPALLGEIKLDMVYLELSKRPGFNSDL